MNELDKVLNRDEKILWQGQPRIIPFFIDGLVPVIVTTLVLGTGFFIFKNTEHTTKDAIIVGLTYIFFGLGSVFYPVYRVLSHRYTQYAITDKRVIIQCGVIGRADLLMFLIS